MIPKLETKKLTLRKMNSLDAKNLVLNGNEKEISLFTWYIPFPFTQKEALKIIEKQQESGKNDKEMYRWGIELKEEHKIIGIIDIYALDKKNKKAQIGYWIGKTYRRKGYTSEAVKEILSYSFNNLHLNKISAKTLSQNEASNHLLKKMGFRKVGLLKQDKIIDSEKHDSFLWEILNPQHKF
jgi:ribosomal-protein-alanine N-acetyltransferase